MFDRTANLDAMADIDRSSNAEAVARYRQGIRADLREIRLELAEIKAAVQSVLIDRSPESDEDETDDE